MTTTPATVAQALAQVAAAVGVVTKEGQATYGEKYSYRRIDDIYNALHRPLAEAGLTILPTVLESEFIDRPSYGKAGGIEVRLKVRYTFLGPAGDVVTATVVAQALDSGDKAPGKAMSYAFKAMASQVFSLPSDDPDMDNEAGWPDAGVAAQSERAPDETAPASRPAAAPRPAAKRPEADRPAPDPVVGADERAAILERLRALPADSKEQAKTALLNAQLLTKDFRPIRDYRASQLAQMAHTLALWEAHAEGGEAFGSYVVEPPAQGYTAEIAEAWKLEDATKFDAETWGMFLADLSADPGRALIHAKGISMDLGLANPPEALDRGLDPQLAAELHQWVLDQFTNPPQRTAA